MSDKKKSFFADRSLARLFQRRMKRKKERKRRRIEGSICFSFSKTFSKFWKDRRISSGVTWPINTFCCNFHKLANVTASRSQDETKLCWGKNLPRNSIVFSDLSFSLKGRLCLSIILWRRLYPCSQFIFLMSISFLAWNEMINIKKIGLNKNFSSNSAIKEGSEEKAQ